MTHPLGLPARLIGVALLALVPACYSPAFPDGALACSSAQTCPDGYQCASNGYCYSNGAAVPPDAPTGVTALPGVRSAQVSWSAPARDGGSAITLYTVTASPGGATASSATLSANINGLDNGTAYTFTVVANNAIGPSRASLPSAAISTFALPGAPADLAAQAVAHGASLAWSAPADSGGTPVTGYDVQVSLNGGAYVPASPSPFFSGTSATVTQLASGGSYTFEVAAVNAVGQGSFSLPSPALLLPDVPATPAITAPATVSAGQTGVAASVPANAGETYAWTVTGATLTNPDGAAGELASGADTITFTVTAPLGGQVLFSCVATNAIGSSAAGTFTASVTGAPMQPTIQAASVVTVGDTGITAQVVAHPGMTYAWTLSSNATLTGSDLHGVTAGGFNTITYNLNGAAVAGGQVSLTAVEVNPSQVASAPGTWTQLIAPAPVAPAIQASSAAVAPGKTYSATIVGTPQTGVTYAFAIAEVDSGTAGAAAACPASGPNLCTLSGDTITFTVDDSLPTDGTRALQLQLTAMNQAGRTSAATPLTLAVIAPPSSTITFGAPPAGDGFGANITAGQTREAFVEAGEASYAWSVSAGAIATGAGTRDVTFNSGAAASGSTITLTCVITNAAASTTATATVNVVAAPGAPSVAVAAYATDPSVPLYASRQYTATLTPGANAGAGTTYRWTVTGGTICTGSGTLCGIAPISGAVPASGTFKYTVNAAVGASLSFSAVAIDAAGTASPSATSAQQQVIAAPEPPSIATPFASPGAPAGATFTAFAPDATYQLAVAAPHSGMSYVWTIGAATCPGNSSFCTNEAAAGAPAESAIQLTVDGTISSSGAHPESPPEVGDQVTIFVAEMNAAGDLASSASPLVVDVIGAPSAPAIAVAYGARVLDGISNPFLITEGKSAAPFVDTPGSPNPLLAQSYLWTATSAGQSALAPPSTAAGAPGADPRNASLATDTISIVAPAYGAGASVSLGVETWNAAAYASAAPVSLVIEPAPPTPALDIPNLDSDVRTPKALTFGAYAGVNSDSPPSNADGSSMDYSCATDANSTYDDDLTGGVFSIRVSASPQANGSGAYSTTVSCTLTNAAGDSATGSLTAPLAPPLAVVALTPASGSTDVPTAAVPTVLFSYPPDPSTLSIDASCSGSVSLENTGDFTCPAITFMQDATNPALFHLEHAAPFESGGTYSLIVATGPGSVADLQGAPLGTGASATFTVHLPPDIAAASVHATPSLQSLAVSWTNPDDPAQTHVRVTASAIDGSGAPSVAVDSANAAATSVTLAGLWPQVQYALELQVAESDDESILSAGIAPGAQTTTFSGSPLDFSAGQTVSGLGPSYNGANATQFSLTWDSANLYLGMEQADALTALRNDGDSLWVAIDQDGLGADTHGSNVTRTEGNVGSGEPQQIIWPFNADYVVELTLTSGGVVASVLDIAANQLQPLTGALQFNGALAEVAVPASSLGGTGTPLRFAMAFVNIPDTGSDDGTVIDLAPAAFSPITTDGHVPATDVLGKLASITNCIDTQGHAYQRAHAQTSLQASAREPAPALVTLRLDATSAGFAEADLIQLQGNLPPLSYTLSDSLYALANDGTRGSDGNPNHYSGAFNFGVLASEPPGTNTNELFFKFTQNGNPEPKFPSGSDRVWTLSGADEVVGQGGDFIVWNTVYSLTHSFALSFGVTNPWGVNSNVVTGAVPELGTWTPSAGVTLNNQGDGFWLSQQVTFTDHDFVTTPLEFKAVDTDNGGQLYETQGNNHTMNDDVINQRQLNWTWNDGTNF